MAGLLDPTDDIVTPEERKAITQQNLFSTLLQGGMQLVAGGENLLPWQRAQMIGQAAQTFGGMPTQNQQMLANAAQQKLAGTKYAEAKQKMKSQKEWEATLGDTNKMQAFVGGLPPQLQGVAEQYLRAAGPAGMVQLLTHGNDMETKNLQIEQMKREAARQAQWSQIMTGQGGTPPQQPTPMQLPGFQYPGQQAAPTGGAVQSTEPPPQSVVRLTPKQQALAAPSTAPQQPFQPLTMNDVINGMNPAQRAALAAMKPDVGVGKLFELANQNDKVAAWDSVTNQAVFVPKNMPPNNRFRPMDAEKMRVEAEKLAQSQRQDLVSPSGGVNQTLIDAKSAQAQAEAAAQAKVEQQFRGTDKLTELAIKSYQETMRPAALSAAADKLVLFDMEDLLQKGIADGPMVDVRMMGGRVSEFLGLGDLSNPMLDRAAFNNLAAMRVIKVLESRALGSGTAVSDNDRQFVETLVGKNGHFSAGEMKKLVALGLRYSDRQIARHDDEVKRLKTLLPNAPDDYFAIGSPQRSQPPPPPPPPGGPPKPKVTTQQQYNALPRGTAYVAPDGLERTKP